LEREQWLALAQSGRVEEMQRHWVDLVNDPRSDGPAFSRSFVVAALARIRLRDARRVLDAWEADYPTDPGPHVFRGMIHAIQLEWEDAGRAYLHALELAPDDTAARRGLAESLAKRLRFGDALAEWTRLLAVDATDVEAAIGRCDCLVQLGEVDSARGELEALLRSMPENVTVLELAGRLELSAGTPARAVALLSRAVDLRPEDAELRYARGRALRLAGDVEAAREHLAYREAAAEPLDRLRKLLVQLPQQPWDADIRADIGELTARWKSREEARLWFLRALDVDPAHARARAALGQVADGAKPAPGTADESVATGSNRAEKTP
ncbi:MAG: tetratricopeptide repeat protein, partial [Planctomycetia bacterium]